MKRHLVVRLRGRIRTVLFMATFVIHTSAYSHCDPPGSQIDHGIYDKPYFIYLMFVGIAIFCYT